MATIDSPEIPGREGTALGYVVASELAVDLAGTGALEAAFRDRLGEVEDHGGFLRLEVWRDNHHEGAYQMITWWTDEKRSGSTWGPTGTGDRTPGYRRTPRSHGVLDCVGSPSWHAEH